MDVIISWFYFYSENLVVSFPFITSGHKSPDMVSEITAGIEVSVQTMYQEGHSLPEENQYVFAYKINISNHNDYTVQLLSRRWIITNGIGGVEIVEGDGVVGR